MPLHRIPLEMNPAIFHRKETQSNLLPMTTLYDIAKAVGVNPSTVSRALTDSPKLREDTKNKIRVVATRMGYRQNAAARSLVTKKTHTFGMVVPTARCMEHTLFSAMLEGISQEVHRIGYALMLSVTDDHAKRSAETIAKLEEHRVEGYLLAWFKEKYIDEPELLKLIEGGGSFVVLGDRHLTSEKINLVACDNFLGAYHATQHLIELGHTRIATITSPMERPITQNRWKGFISALNQAGIEYTESERKKWHRETDLTQTGAGAEAMRHLLAADFDFTVVFAFSDRAAIEAIHVIVAQGLRVPDDIAVIGFDGADYGELVSPALTTVKQPYFEIGVEAVRMLKRLTDGHPLEKNTRFVAPKLVIRESCGAKPS